MMHATPVNAPVAAALLLGCCMAVTPALGQKAPRIVCWTDENGQRACGDRVPPQYARSERRLVDEQGRVIATQPRELTAAELAERQRREAEAAAEQKRQTEQAAYDRFLMQSYTQVSDLQHARDERLATLESRLGLMQKNSASARNTLGELRKQAAAAPADAALGKQLQDQERALADSERGIAALQQERRGVCDMYARDIRRFEQLRNLPQSPPLACPGAQAATLSP